MFDLSKICFLLFQANGETILGKGILDIMSRGNFNELQSLILQLADLFKTWPELLKTVFKPADRLELIEQLALI